MNGTFNAKITSPGAPVVSDYSATNINVAPNAPPIPTQTIQSNDNENRHLSLGFEKNGLVDGSHPLTVDNTSVVYSSNSETFFPRISSGNIDIDSLAGTYKGTFKATWTDRPGREWTVDSNFDIKVIPQK